MLPGTVVVRLPQNKVLTKIFSVGKWTILENILLGKLRKCGLDEW